MEQPSPPRATSCAGGVGAAAGGLVVVGLPGTGAGHAALRRQAAPVAGGATAAGAAPAGGVSEALGCHGATGGGGRARHGYLAGRLCRRFGAMADAGAPECTR